MARARVDHFVDNVGRGGLVRTVVVGLAMIVLAIARFVDGGQWLPLATLALGLAGPTLARRRLVAHLETSLQILRVTSYGIVVGVVVAGLARDRLPLDERLLLAGLVGIVTAYLTAFAWVFSDPTVVREP